MVAFRECKEVWVKISGLWMFDQILGGQFANTRKLRYRRPPPQSAPIEDAATLTCGKLGGVHLESLETLDTGRTTTEMYPSAPSPSRVRIERLEDTRAFAQQLAQTLPRGSLVLLIGPMGAGKTTLVKLIAEALGFKGEVTSPTYTLIHEYPTPQGLIVHIDAYRMADQEELYHLGLEDYLPEARLVFIEWGQPEIFPNAVQVHITLTEDARVVELQAAKGSTC